VITARPGRASWPRIRADDVRGLLCPPLCPPERLVEQPALKEVAERSACRRALPGREVGLPAKDAGRRVTLSHPHPQRRQQWTGPRWRPQDDRGRARRLIRAAVLVHEPEDAVLEAYLETGS